MNPALKVIAERAVTAINKDGTFLALLGVWPDAYGVLILDKMKREKANKMLRRFLRGEMRQEIIGAIAPIWKDDRIQMAAQQNKERRGDMLRALEIIKKSMAMEQGETNDTDIGSSNQPAPPATSSGDAGREAI